MSYSKYDSSHDQEKQKQESTKSAHTAVASTKQNINQTCPVSVDKTGDNAKADQAMVNEGGGIIRPLDSASAVKLPVVDKDEKTSLPHVRDSREKSL